MNRVDLTLYNFPVFSLDIEDWMQVNCNYLKIEILYFYFIYFVNDKYP